MAESAQGKDHPKATVLLDVQPRSSSGDLAPRTALPEEFRRRAGEIADSVSEVAEQFLDRLQRVLNGPSEYLSNHSPSH